MTMTSLNAVGFCAHYSPQGDWAFNFALGLARRLTLPLNVFHFLSDPYVPEDHTSEGLNSKELERLIIEREKKMRLYYDIKAGDYLDVGFRLCEDREWVELHRCLMKREFQILVLGYTSHDATFAGKPIQTFGDSFVCPVILIGPDRPDQLHLNRPAGLIAEKLGLSEDPWSYMEPNVAVI